MIGVQALAVIKHVGLNVAADAMMSQTYIGANGGLVLVVCGDPGIHSSQNEQDSRSYCRLAFELSERFDTPVIVSSTTRLSHIRGPKETEQ